MRCGSPIGVGVSWLRMASACALSASAAISLPGRLLLDIGDLLVGCGQQAIDPGKCRTVEAELRSGDSHIGKPVLSVVEARLDRRLVLGRLKVRADPHSGVLLALGLVCGGR